MRVTSSDLSSRLALALLTALLFIAPSGQTHAQTRAFQMALWVAREYPPGVDTDIPSFYDGEDQPDGFSILIGFKWDLPLFAHRPYDWARILAVEVDEPYNEFNRVRCWSTSTVAAVNARAQDLADRAAELKSISPLTRFWVNLARPQTDWSTLDPCRDDGSSPPPDVNRPYIDVISVDIYYTPFNTAIKAIYDQWVMFPAKPDQQVALIPGTFYREGKDHPATQASYLQGYFDYANNANQNCNRPLGSRGQTGSFDGCPVWIVMGWLSHNATEDGVEYIGERDPRSAPIADVWQAQLAVPPRSDLANQLKPAELVPTLLPLFMD